MSTLKSRAGYSKSWRRTRRALGLCDSCSNPSLGGVTCAVCTKKRKEKNNLYRAKQGKRVIKEEDDDNGKYKMTEQEKQMFDYRWDLLFTRVPDYIERLS